jgi:hypothetical protein
MVAGSFAAPYFAWRALARASDRPFAVAAMVLGCIDAAFVTFVIVMSLFG